MTSPCLTLSSVMRTQLGASFSHSLNWNLETETREDVSHSVIQAKGTIGDDPLVADSEAGGVSRAWLGAGRRKERTATTMRQLLVINVGGIL